MISKLFIFSLFLITFIPDYASQMSCFKINGVLGCDAMIQQNGSVEDEVPVECRGELKLCNTFRVGDDGNVEMRTYHTDGCVQNQDGTFHYDTSFRRGNINQHCEITLQKGFNMSFCCCQPTNNGCAI